MQGKKSNTNTKENRMNKNNKGKQANREFKKNRNEVLEEREDIIIGRNAVIEALKNDSRTIETLYISNNKLEGSINTIVGMAKEKKIIIKEVDKRKLDSMCDGETHQGVIAKVTPFKYCEVSDILEKEEKLHL